MFSKNKPNNAFSKTNFLHANHTNLHHDKHVLFT